MFGSGDAVRIAEPSGRRARLFQPIRVRKFSGQQGRVLHAERGKYSNKMVYTVGFDLGDELMLTEVFFEGEVEAA